MEVTAVGERYSRKYMLNDVADEADRWRNAADGQIACGGETDSARAGSAALRIQNNRASKQWSYYVNFC